MARGILLSDRIKNRIKKLYLEVGLTQNQIAEELRITQNSVSRVLKTERLACPTCGIVCNVKRKGAPNENY